MKRCPYCSEVVQDDTRVCPHCRTDLIAQVNLPPQAPAPQQAYSQPGQPQQSTAGDTFQTTQPQTSGKATASLISGIAAYVIAPFFGAIVAIILGHLGLSEIKKSAGRLKGDGLAIAGLVLGYVQIAGLPFILIIAAIAIPNLIRARMAANEASAVGLLRAITTAEITYSTACPKIGYASTLTELGPNGAACPQGANQINPVLALGTQSGYKFTPHNSSFTRKAPETGFGWNADPISPSSGTRHFFVDQTGIIRSNPTEVADVDSPPLT
jgi:hypothetical protein